MTIMRYGDTGILNKKESIDKLMHHHPEALPALALRLPCFWKVNANLLLLASGLVYVLPALQFLDNSSPLSTS